MSLGPAHTEWMSRQASREVQQAQGKDPRKSENREKQNHTRLRGGMMTRL